MDIECQCGKVHKFPPIKDIPLYYVYEVGVKCSCGMIIYLKARNRPPGWGSYIPEKIQTNISRMEGG